MCYQNHVTECENIVHKPFLFIIDYYKEVPLRHFLSVIRKLCYLYNDIPYGTLIHEFKIAGEGKQRSQKELVLLLDYLSSL